MNATALVPETTSPVLASPNSIAEETIEAWTRLVRHYYPNLATPIARALAQRAVQGPYGAALQAIAQGLAQFDDSSLHEMTGSELQMLSALLQELRERTQRLLMQVNGLWHTD
jgi:hypothetical protein